MGLGGLQRDNPVSGRTAVACHLATEAVPARAHIFISTLESLYNFHGKSLLANSGRTINQNRLREPVFSERRHHTDADTFLRYGTL